jgi:hypothetical protein
MDLHVKHKRERERENNEIIINLFLPVNVFRIAVINEEERKRDNLNMKIKHDFFSCLPKS